MEGTPDLTGYLADRWLRSHLHVRPVGRDAAAEREAVAAYLDAQPPHWRERLQTITARLPLVDPRTRLVIFLIAQNEEELISSCLEAIGRDIQSSGMTGSCELLAVRLTRAGQPADGTSQRVRAFQADHPQLQVHLVEVEWPAACTTFLALSRKLAVDVVAERAARSGMAAPLYLISEDADVEWVENGRSSFVVSTFDARPALDALRGWHLRTLPLLEYLPFFVERVTWRACEYELSAPRLGPGRHPGYQFAWNRVVTSGWNLAFTLEAYAQAGGYTTSVELFEDVDLGQRISVMRGRADERGFLPDTSTVAYMPFEACSDGRRAFAAQVRGTDTYGSSPSIAAFTDATARVRTWPMSAARDAAQQRCSLADIEGVLRRRRAEIARMVPSPTDVGPVMDAGWRAIGLPGQFRGSLRESDLKFLRRRQHDFLAAASEVSAGCASTERASVLRPTADG